MSEPISTQLQKENEQIKQKVVDLEQEIAQKKTLLNYYKKKIWYNDLLILKQSKP